MNKKAFYISIFSMLFSVVSHSQTYGANSIVWQQRSVYRNIIVLEGNGHRCLTFGKRSARQSCINLTDPNELVFGYTQGIFQAINALPNPQSFLIVGIGGGTLPMAIRRHYPTATIDAVELDPAVVAVAVKYFQYKPDLQLRSFNDDGRMFIRKAIRLGTKYDAVVLDAFDKDYIPEHMTTAEFLGQAKTVLSNTGVLISNTFDGTAFSPYEEATYQTVFIRVFESRVAGGNRLLMAGPGVDQQAEKMPKMQRLTRSRAEPMTDRYAPANALMAR